MIKMIFVGTVVVVNLKVRLRRVSTVSYALELLVEQLEHPATATDRYIVFCSVNHLLAFTAVTPLCPFSPVLT